MSTVYIVLLCVVAIGALVLIARRYGVISERNNQAQYDLEAAEIVAREKAKAEGMSDEELEEEVSEWTQKKPPSS